MHLRVWAVLYTELTCLSLECCSLFFFFPSFLGASISESQQPDHVTWRVVKLTKLTGNGHPHMQIISVLLWNYASICFSLLISVKGWHVWVAYLGLVVCCVHFWSCHVQAVVARANSLKNSGVPDDIFQLDDLSVLVHKSPHSLFSLASACIYFCHFWRGNEHLSVSNSQMIALKHFLWCILSNNMLPFFYSPPFQPFPPKKRLFV